MNHGSCWEAICVRCGKRSSAIEYWQEPEPAGTAPHDGTCCEATAFAPGLREARWHRTLVRRLPLGRMSGFSTSESDFVPHWNRAFGKRVESLAEMRALQAQHGACDAVVKGDGADRLAPRDLGTRLKHHRDTQEKLARGEPFEVARGVRVEFTESES